jgi:hypothetical protein
MTAGNGHGTMFSIYILWIMKGPLSMEAKGREEFSYSGKAITVRTKSLATKQSP